MASLLAHGVAAVSVERGSTAAAPAAGLGSALAARSERAALSASWRAAATWRRRRCPVARAEVKYLDLPSAKKAVEEDGYTVIDVRDETQYKRAHIAKAIHVPLFVVNEDNDPATLVKRQAHNSFAGIFYGLAFTKPNEQFVQQVEQKVGKDSKLLLVCQEGLRSSTASEQLDAAGFQSVAMLTDGLQQVPVGTFAKEGSSELKDAGKGGFVTVQKQISYVLGGILLSAYLYLQFFPDSALKFLGGAT